MEFREFVEKAFEVVTLYQDPQSVYGSVSRKEFDSLSDTELESLLFDRSWVSGGYTGKSCWGGEGYARSGDAPEDITPDVAKVLLAVDKEDISFVMYMAKIQPLVTSTELSDNSDYYGNYTNYSRLYLILPIVKTRGFCFC